VRYGDHLIVAILGRVLLLIRIGNLTIAVSQE